MISLANCIVVFCFRLVPVMGGRVCFEADGDCVSKLNLGIFRWGFSRHLTRCMTWYTLSGSDCVFHFW